MITTMVIEIVLFLLLMFSVVILTAMETIIKLIIITFTPVSNIHDIQTAAVIGIIVLMSITVCLLKLFSLFSSSLSSLTS